MVYYLYSIFYLVGIFMLSLIMLKPRRVQSFYLDYTIKICWVILLFFLHIAKELRFFCAISHCNYMRETAYICAKKLIHHFFAQLNADRSHDTTAHS